MIALSRPLITPQRVVLTVICLGYLITICICIPGYLDLFSVNTVLGFAAIVFTWRGEAIRQTRFGWLAAVAILLLVYAWIPSKFILYVVIGMALFSLMEMIGGRAGWLAMISLILMSPLCAYFTNVFGFPIRLQLSRMAAGVLNVFDNGYRMEGNVLLKGTREFSVDTACMGLHMLTGSLLTGMAVLGIYQRRQEEKLPLVYACLMIAAIGVLNLFSNLIRIISLVEFQVSPENQMHAAIGLVCFLIYVLLPSVFLINYLVRRFGTPFNRTSENSRLTPKLIGLQVALLILIFGIAMAGKNRSMNEYLMTGTVKAPEYHIETLPDAIVKLSNGKGLIYLKPIIGFYSSDHQPTICWKGSGYEFKNLEPFELDGQSIYLSRIENGKDNLYTAWWYDNGKFQTISQLAWRWDSFKYNRPWVLVEVTAASKAELIRQVCQIRKINPCRMLLGAG